MALEKNVQLAGTLEGVIEGVAITDENYVYDAGLCYIKVIKVSGDKVKGNMIVSFAGTKNTFQKSYKFTPSMSGDNFIKQAYDYLKTLEEFEGATDV
jgi:hypothetical protein